MQERIDRANEAIRAAQHSANEETKSSAGDKYETGRAMAQLEIEKNTWQKAESLKLMEILSLTDPKLISSIVQRGSLVLTNEGSFYVCVSAGKFIIDQVPYFAISSASPLGQQLMGLAPQSSFIFNDKKYQILVIE